MPQQGPDTGPHPRTSSPLRSNRGAKGATAADQPVDDQARFLMPERVAKVIDVIRPVIQADGGDLTLHDVDPQTGVVSVELHGACVTCPVSSQTLKDGIETILTSRVVGVTSVRHVGEDLADPRAADPTETGTVVSL